MTTWVPMFLFVILFGLSMDYEVFPLSRIREAYDATGDNSASVAHGLARTARVITAAAAIMVVVFMANVVGANVSVKQIGLGLAVAVLIDATLVRMVLVPAVMELLARRTGGCPGRWPGCCRRPPCPRTSPWPGSGSWPGPPGSSWRATRESRKSRPGPGREGVPGAAGSRPSGAGHYAARGCCPGLPPAPSLMTLAPGGNWNSEAGGEVVYHSIGMVTEPWQRKTEPRMPGLGAQIVLTPKPAVR